jgi:phage replication-related protein YjqB (UPF0714/DUF867 family)
MYRSFEELATNERESIDYQIRVHRRNSPIAIVAPHGGDIEENTSVIGEAIADEQFSFYAFEGIKRSRNFELHIASCRFDEPECVAMIRDARVVVTIHGLRAGEGEFVRVGGSHGELRRQLVASLSEHGFEAMEETATSEHAGSHPENLCNRFSPGIQLEISAALRDRLKEGGDDLDSFAFAVRSALIEQEMAQATRLGAG